MRARWPSSPGGGAGFASHGVRLKVSKFGNLLGAEEHLFGDT